MKAWTTIATIDIVNNQWVHLSANRVEIGNGKILDPFYCLHPKDWVVVLARTVLGEWVIVRQYRYGAQEVCIEFPAGTIDAGEDAIECAKRELLEETGFGGGEWSCLGRFWVNPANARNSFHVFFADRVSKIADQSLDESEDIEVLIWSEADLRQAIAQNTMSNPHHQCSFLRWLIHQEEICG